MDVPHGRRRLTALQLDCTGAGSDDPTLSPPGSGSEMLSEPQSVIGEEVILHEPDDAEAAEHDQLNAISGEEREYKRECSRWSFQLRRKQMRDSAVASAREGRHGEATYYAIGSYS